MKVEKQRNSVTSLHSLAPTRPLLSSQSPQGLPCPSSSSESYIHANHGRPPAVFLPFPHPVLSSLLKTSCAEEEEGLVSLFISPWKGPKWPPLPDHILPWPVVLGGFSPFSCPVNHPPHPMLASPLQSLAGWVESLTSSMHSPSGQASLANLSPSPVPWLEVCGSPNPPSRVSTWRNV